MYNDSQHDRYSESSNHRISIDGLRSSTSRLEQQASYPIYQYSNYLPQNEDAEADYEYEDRVLGDARIPDSNTRADNAGYEGRYKGPQSLQRSSPATDRSHSGDAYAIGRPQSVSSAPPRYPPYHFQHNYFPGAFPYDYDQVSEHFGASAPTTFNEYSPATPIHDRSQPILFDINAPHHHSRHRHFSQEQTLPEFPSWSRTWYGGHHSSHGHAYTSVPPPAGHKSWETDSYSRSAYSGAYPHYSQRQHQRRDFIREERLKMLEKEFGKPRVHHRGGQDDCSEDDYEDGPLPLGSVTSQGRLITERPKVVIALRIMIGIVALAGCACGLGGALLIKTNSVTKPAPKGTLPAYLLYGCSVITLILLLYLYIFRPCCCDPMRKELKANSASGNPLASMVIPILTNGAGGKTKKTGRFSKKGSQQQQQQAPTVNLIVDPALLGIKGNDHDSESEEDERLPGDARRSKKRRNGLGVFGNMQMQRRWQLARSRVKMYTIWDVILLLVWIGCDIVSVGLGKRCPSNAGSWCVYYNAAIACGFINALLLSIAIYFDYRDLKISRNAPKAPM